LSPAGKVYILTEAFQPPAGRMQRLGTFVLSRFGLGFSANAEGATKAINSANCVTDTRHGDASVIIDNAISRAAPRMARIPAFFPIPLSSRYTAIPV